MSSYQKPKEFVNRLWNDQCTRWQIPAHIERARKRFLIMQEEADKQYQRYSEMNAEFIRLSEEKAKNDETERLTKRRPRK
jgi:hypothetical protein